MFNLKTTIRVGLAAMSSLVVAGCVSYDRMQAAPSIGQQIAVQLTSDELSTWSDLPVGAYRIPGSQVIVSGQQKRAKPGGGGLLGLLIIDTIETHKHAASVESSEAALRLHVDDELRADVGAAIANPALSDRLSMVGSGRRVADTVIISPAIVLTFFENSKMMPFVVLKAEMRSDRGDVEWSTRYFASTGAERPLEGDDGWLANGGAPLSASISASLAQAVKVALADVAHPYARDPAKLVRVRAHVPYQPEHFYLVGNALTEDEHYLAIATKIVDVAVMSGVSIVDKAVVSVTPATDAARTSLDPVDSPRERAKAAKLARRDAAIAARRSASAASTAASSVPSPQAARGVPEPAVDAQLGPAAPGGPGNPAP